MPLPPSWLYRAVVTTFLSSKIPHNLDIRL